MEKYHIRNEKLTASESHPLPPTPKKEIIELEDTAVKTIKLKYREKKLN